MCWMRDKLTSPPGQIKRCLLNSVQAAGLPHQWDSLPKPVAKIFAASKTLPPIGIFTVAEFTAFVEWDDGQLDWRGRMVDYKEISYTWTELFIQGQVTSFFPDRVLVITANEAWLPVLGSVLKQVQKTHHFYLTSLEHLTDHDNALTSSIWRPVAQFRSQQAHTLQPLPITVMQ